MYIYSLVCLYLIAVDFNLNYAHELPHELQTSAAANAFALTRAQGRGLVEGGRQLLNDKM